MWFTQQLCEVFNAFGTTIAYTTTMVLRVYLTLLYCSMQFKGVVSESFAVV